MAVLTRAGLGADLRDLGIGTADTLLVHASLRSFGWVVGGATAVVQALLDVIGPAGTLVVPAQTADNRDPSTWENAEDLREWWPTIREHLPGFDPAVTPSQGMGRVAEQVRTWPGALRSDHPQTSFAAVGPQATFLLRGHARESPLGPQSPLARLEDLDAKVVLLGVGFDRATCFHLAEYRLPSAPRRTNECAVVGPRGREWVQYEGIALNDGDFAQLGKAFETDVPDVVTVRMIGEALCRQFSIRSATTFAEVWMHTNRLAADTRLHVPLRRR